MNELLSRHRPVLITNCLLAGNLLVGTGEIAFFRKMAAALAPRAAGYLVELSDPLTSVVKLADAIRDCDDPPAVLLHFRENDPRFARFWKGEADVVIEARTPDLARVVKLRDFPNTKSPLVIENGVVHLCGTRTSTALERL